jgi:hypothetical protein
VEPRKEGKKERKKERKIQSVTAAVRKNRHLKAEYTNHLYACLCLNLRTGT